MTSSGRPDDPDVEFLEPDGTGEVLDTCPRRPVPRWVVVLGALVVLGAIVAAVVLRGGSSTPQSRPTSSTPSVIPPDRSLENAYALVGDTVDRRLFALSGSRLFAVAPDGTPEGRGTPVQVGSLTDSEVQLVLDAPHHLLWAVPQNATGHDGLAAGFAEYFDPRQLSRSVRIPLPGRVQSAATLDGRLYVTTDDGLWRSTTDSGPFERVRTVTPAADTQLVGDPSRHRLILVRHGARTTAFFYPSAAAPRTLPGRTLTLAVVGGTIWRAGSQRGRSVLTTLDPTTLASRANLAPRLTDGRPTYVEIQGTGDRSLYVTVGTSLRCLSGSTGRTLRVFGNLPGVFASFGGRGFVGTAARLAPVRMGRCPG